ncbi:RWD domain-containing protein 2A [Tachypleus tridentatus]|uniref:RWD domain-containing protein 2A n=1 Tax=Tachypleus tridentatus TaxID=6853 RepID=UPI003FD5A5DD
MENNLSLLDLAKLQLDELEMIESMYPNSDEFKVDDPSVVDHIKAFVEGKSNELPPRLDFTLWFDVKGKKLEVNFSLPHDYPQSEPEVYTRSAFLSRDHQYNLNSALMDYLTSLPAGELCLSTIILWLQENLQTYFSWDSKECHEAEHPKGETTFNRLWIYSHHIYNKYKRKRILELAHELELTGFCLPGKPGIICVEGSSNCCTYFWQNIKNMNWKKIVLKKNENLETKNSATNTGKHFQTFDEISFQPRRGPGKEYHMDMGEFFKYLEKHNCSYAFSDLFGVDGKSVL